jgi:hypothetical protein
MTFGYELPQTADGVPFTVAELGGICDALRQELVVAELSDGPGAWQREGPRHPGARGAE